MSDFPNFDKPTDEPNEDCSLSLLIEGGDTVDATMVAENDDDSTFDSCDTLPPNLQSTSSMRGNVFSASSTGGDVLACESPFVPLKSGAEVLKYFSPKKRASGDVNNASSTDKEKFTYMKRKASEGVKHYIFFKDVQEPDVVDALGGGQGDVADSPNSAPSKPTKSRPTYKQCVSIEENFRYQMDFKERGCFIIFNEETFDKYNDLNPNLDPLKPRAGSDRDAFNLENAAYSIGFEHVRIIHNATKREILQWIQRLAWSDHSNYDCFACAILTHGGNGDTLYARDKKMKLTDFTRPFCADVCPSLAGKPKLFFIQACRGVKLDHGKKHQVPARALDSVDGPTPITDGSTERPKMKDVHIPTEADFLIANSTIPDYYAWRNESNGSWFIQSLCAIFKRYGHRMELMQMMTRVNRMVAYDFASTSDDEAYDQMKQIPSIATRLTAEVYFTAKENSVQSPAPRTNYAPPSTSTVVYQSRTESRTDAADVVEEESVVASTMTFPQVNYVTDDYNVSPGLEQLDAKFIYPSPKNVTKAPKTKVAPHPPTKACPRSRFPHLLENRDSLSRSIPQVAVTRKLSNVESHSQSWNTPVKMHPSSTIPSSMNQLSPYNPRRGHRCSLPEDSLDIEPSERKGIKQTNL